MDDDHSASGHDWPSLNTIRGELAIQEEAVAQTSAALDTKAGIILGACGVLITLNTDQPAGLIKLGQCLLFAAGAIAVWAFLPRSGGAITPRHLRESYLLRPEHETKLAVLDARIFLLEADHEVLKRKSGRIRHALLLVAVGVLLQLAVSLWSPTDGGRHGSTQQRSPGPTANSSPESSVSSGQSTHVEPGGRQASPPASAATGRGS